MRKDDARQAMRVGAANLRLLRDAGVPIIFGNDASFGLSLLARPAGSDALRVARVTRAYLEGAAHTLTKTLRSWVRERVRRA